MKMKIPRLMISAAGSNSGKTTVTTALLKALSMMEMKVAAFKAGPDFIDPMFHTEVIKIPSRNLDIFMLGENKSKYILGKNGFQKDISIIEGVMGYYDGIGNSTSSSTYELARLLNCPTVLVVNPQNMAASVCAIIEGFKNFREESNIKGVILNNTSPKMYKYYKKIIEANTDIPLYGYMPYLENCKLESRDLGLVRAQEISNLESIVEELGKQALKTIDIDGLLSLADKAGPIEYDEPELKFIGKTKIAIAKDKAFCFYYKDSLEVLEALGADLIDFSPLKDKELPAGIGGLYIGGGYPDLYMDELSTNKSMLKSIKEKTSSGLPTFAECGGYMYLMESFRDKNNTEYKLVGSIDGKSYMTSSLSRFGYIKLTSENNNLMCSKGQSIKGHEFHYSDSTNQGDSFIASKPESKRTWKTVIADERKFAGFPYINLLGNIGFAENFIRKSIAYERENK